MRLIKWTCNTEFTGYNRSYDSEFEVDDDETDEEIDALVQTNVLNNINWCWEEDGRGKKDAE